MARRPKSEEELQQREAVGIIRASRFVRKYARSHQEISFATLLQIHEQIFHHAWPEIAGVYREENLEISGSTLQLPHFTEVPGLMNRAEKEFLEKLQQLEGVEGIITGTSSESEEWNECTGRVVHLAAWLHHLVTCIHPFREGNGRTARLAANLILERYGLVGISIKIERGNKDRYRSALAQIDEMKDYEPLEDLIYEGLIDRYNGVQVKYYSTKQK